MFDSQTKKPVQNVELAFAQDSLKLAIIKYQFKSDSKGQLKVEKEKVKLINHRTLPLIDKILILNNNNNNNYQSKQINYVKYFNVHSINSVKDSYVSDSIFLIKTELK